METPKLLVKIVKHDSLDYQFMATSGLLQFMGTISENARMAAGNAFLNQPYLR